MDASQAIENVKEAKRKEDEQRKQNEIESAKQLVRSLDYYREKSVQYLTEIYDKIKIASLKGETETKYYLSIKNKSHGRNITAFLSDIIKEDLSLKGYNCKTQCENYWATIYDGGMDLCACGSEYGSDSLSVIVSW